MAKEDLNDDLVRKKTGDNRDVIALFKYLTF